MCGTDSLHYNILCIGSLDSILFCGRVGKFLPEGGKNRSITMEKTVLSKIVFAGKNTFCHILFLN